MLVSANNTVHLRMPGIAHDQVFMRLGTAYVGCHRKLNKEYKLEQIQDTLKNVNFAKAFFCMKLTVPAFILVLALAVAGFSLNASAQECGVVPSTLATLSAPQDTFPTLWSMNDGDKNLYDRFVGGIIDANDGDTIAAGERFYDEGENIGLTLRKINGRGRTQWERILNNYGFEKIVRIIGLEKGFLVLANKGGSKQPSTVWAGFFDSEGNLAESRDIKPPSGALKAFDILPLNNGRAFILSGQVTDGAEAPYTALYRLDRKAQITSRKAYQMGSKTDCFLWLPEKAALFTAAAISSIRTGGVTPGLSNLRKMAALSGNASMREEKPRNLPKCSRTKRTVFSYLAIPGPIILKPRKAVISGDG